MNSNKQNLINKIIYRSQYRGSREMDKLLNSFVLKYIDNLEDNKLLELEKFLDIDDDELYKFYNNLENKISFEDKYILNLFKNFKYNKG